jgi:hypothetical protein
MPLFMQMPFHMRNDFSYSVSCEEMLVTCQRFLSSCRRTRFFQESKRITPARTLRLAEDVPTR